VFLYIQRNKFLLSGCRYKPVTAPGVAANQKFVSRLQFLSFYTLWADTCLMDIILHCHITAIEKTDFIAIKKKTDISSAVPTAFSEQLPRSAMADYVDHSIMWS
jgi:hypothetical protein